MIGLIECGVTFVAVAFWTKFEVLYEFELLVVGSTAW